MLGIWVAMLHGKNWKMCLDIMDHSEMCGLHGIHLGLLLLSLMMLVMLKTQFEHWMGGKSVDVQ
jgi:hypothetical protein